MLLIYYVTSNIATTDQTVHVHVYACGVHSTRFQAQNKPKMGTSLCDVTMTLKQQEKNGNIFFLKRDTFSCKKMYV